jgi:hypothetical protein
LSGTAALLGSAVPGRKQSMLKKSLLVLAFTSVAVAAFAQQTWR